MADGSLYGEGAGLLRAAGDQASNIAADKTKRMQIQSQEAQSANSEVGAAARQMSAQEAAVNLEKLKAQDKMQGKVLTITPQLALGLVKNTGDKEWMQAIGQDMRSDVLMGMFTHGMNLQFAKQRPQFVKRYTNGKEQTGLSWMDENGAQQEWFGEGIDPAKIHPGGGRKGGAGADPAKMTFQQKKAFVDNYTKRQAAYNKNIEFGKPEEYAGEKQYLDDNKDLADKLLHEMSRGQAGNAESGGSAGGGGAAGGGPALDTSKLFEGL